MAKVIQRHDIDLVHTHMSRAHSFGTLLKFFSRAPIVKTAHSRSFQLHWKVNDRVIANSKATHDYLVRVNKVNASKMDTIHCFVDSEKYDNVTIRDIRRTRRQLRFNNGEFVVGIVGQVIARKGHEYLVKALPELCEAIPNLKLLIIGRFHRSETYVKRIRKFILENGLEKRTRWIGIRENVQDFYSIMDVCVVPSLEEPLGLVAIESHLAGTPVVAANVGGLPEIIEHERTGLLVPPRDPQAIAKAILRIKTERPLQNRIINCGHRRSSHRFSTENLTTQVENVYRRLLASHRAAA